MSSDGSTDPAEVVARHVEAFNAHDLDALMRCFSPDVTWVTGTDSFSGSSQLRELFGGAFAGLAPQLQLQRLVVQGDLVACELREQYSAAGMQRTDHIAGFYRVEAGLIAAAKIYREGSADV
jgi:uncharacterized protein